MPNGWPEKSSELPSLQYKRPCGILKVNFRSVRLIGDLRTTCFQSATIILPVMNETAALEETVQILLRDVKDQVQEILIVVCKQTTAEAMAVAKRLRKELPELVMIHQQSLPYLGGALREAFDLARGSHVLLMASDLETDPHKVKELIACAARKPSAVIVASRWLKGGSFHGYPAVKLILNRAFQVFFSALYGRRLTDLTYAFRIYPTKLVQSVRWEELRHPLLFEALVKPLRLGVEVIEIPSAWRARTDGTSHGRLLDGLGYLRTGLKTRFSRRQSILRGGS